MLKNAQPIAFAATADPDRAKEFYQRILGLRFVSGDQFAMVFDASGTMLRIQIVEEVKPHPYTALGWRVDDIDKTIRGLTRHGIRFERYEGMGQSDSGVWTSPAGAKIAWFKDPDENILSLTQFRKKRVRTRRDTGRTKGG